MNEFVKIVRISRGSQRENYYQQITFKKNTPGTLEVRKDDSDRISQFMISNLLAIDYEALSLTCL